MIEQDKFLTNVFPEPNTGCWLWAGRHNNAGYGIGHFLKRTMQLAHRYSYFLFIGSFDLSMCVLHHCDNPACVNPEHLYLGDMRQNCIDRDSRGRQRTKRGSDHKLAKLNEDLVRNIRSNYAAYRTPTRKLAKQYGVSQKIIMNVINRKSWTHIL